jgi:cyclase
MLAKRIITTLMLKNGVLYRSKNFIPDYRYTLNFVDMWSVDEIIILDISRNVTFENSSKKNFLNEMKNISKNAYIPITAGGGIRKLKDIEVLLKNGADKVTLNSVCIDNPAIIDQASRQFGKQCIVVCIDVKFENNQYNVMQNYGEIKTNFNLKDYIKKIQDNGAGEIFIQSIDRDGSLLGYDLNLLNYIKPTIDIPLIISSGAGNWAHVKEVLKKDYVSGASLTNIFHFTEKSIDNLKNYLKNDVSIREN